MNGVKNKVKVSPKIVRVWFDTVLNPIFNGLTNVTLYLFNNNYTWNWKYQNFIEIKPITEFFEYKYLPNYEQLISIEMNDFKILYDNYEKIRIEFNNSCIKLFQELISSKDLQKLINDSINKYEKLSLINSDDANYLRKIEAINWISEHLINNKKELPFNDILRIIWNNEIERFYSILNSNGINYTYYDVKKNKAKFEDCVTKTLLRIKECSNELSLKYAVPIVL